MRSWSRKNIGLNNSGFNSWLGDFWQVTQTFLFLMISSSNGNKNNMSLMPKVVGGLHKMECAMVLYASLKSANTILSYCYESLTFGWREVLQRLIFSSSLFPFCFPFCGCEFVGRYMNIHRSIIYNSKTWK